MNLSEAINFSFEALRANRLRTFLTALGLIIGNASVILVVTISLASKNLILDQIRGIGSNLVYADYEAGGQNTAQVEADFVKLSDVQAIRDQLGNSIIAASRDEQQRSDRCQRQNPDRDREWRRPGLCEGPQSHHSSRTRFRRQ
jgi:putative ABC transport system permease protein